MRCIRGFFLTAFDRTLCIYYILWVCFHWPKVQKKIFMLSYANTCLQRRTHSVCTNEPHYTLSLLPLSFFLYLTLLSLSPCVTADWAVGSVVGRSEDAAVHINNAEPQLPPSTVAMAPAHRCHQGGAGNAPLFSLALSFSFSLSLSHTHICAHISKWGGLLTTNQQVRKTASLLLHYTLHS